MFKKYSIQKDLAFLLRHGWTLVGPNTVQYKEFKTKDIQKAARVFRAKLKLQKIIAKICSTNY